MVIILGFLILAVGLVFWGLRARTPQSGVGSDGPELKRHARSALQDIFHSPLRRVDDVRLAAVILMIQIVRTGSPVTASEKTRILEFMENPLGIKAVSTVFERAWPYTKARMPFARIADDLVPLLCRHLTRAERLDLVDMLTQVAEAHSPASDLQSAAIVRLKGRLVGREPDAETAPQEVLRTG